MINLPKVAKGERIGAAKWNRLCDLVAGAVLEGISAEMVASGRDLGASENLPPEPMPVAAPEPAPAEQPAA